MSELLAQTLHEIAEQPLPFVAEVIQFIVLVVILRLLLRRVLGRTLAERRRKIIAELEQAGGAAARHAEAEREAAAIVAEARAQAERTIAAATAAASEARRAGVAEIERDAAAAVARARQAIEEEKARVARDASEQLVDLITVVVRRFLEQAMTETERRALTQKLILDHVKGLAG